MKLSILVATFGEQRWADMARERALPSAWALGPHEVVHEHHRGASEWSTVRNQLAEKATGDWFCFLDADDWLAPGFLVAMKRAEWRASSPGDLILVPAVEYVHADGRCDTACIPNGGLARWPGINIAVCGSLISRTLFLRLGGFDPAHVPYDDYGLWLKADRAEARLVEVPDAVYRASVRDGSAMRDERTRKTRARLHHRLLAEHRRLTRR